MKTRVFTTPNAPAILQHDAGEIKRWKKEIARVGRYEKPSDGIEFEFSRPWLEERVRTFNRMKANGVRVPVPSYHFPNDGDEELHANDATMNKGWVEDLEMDGDSLYAIIDLHGDGANLPLTSDVSLKAPPHWRDGKGNEYDWPIRHVALTPDPCLPGLKPWEQLALSANEYVDVEVLTYTPEAPMSYAKIANVLGLTLDSGDENAEQKITDAILLLQADPEPTPEPEPVITPDPEPTPEPIALGASPVNPILLKTVAKNRTLQLDALASAGKINQAAREKIEAQFSGDNLSLTLSAGTDDGFDAVCEAFACLSPIVETGEATGGQVLQLSNNDNATEQRESIREKMLAAAGLAD